MLPALLKNTRDELNVHFLEIHTLKKNGVRQAMPGGLPGYHNTVLQVFMRTVDDDGGSFVPYMIDRMVNFKLC